MKRGTYVETAYCNNDRCESYRYAMETPRRRCECCGERMERHTVRVRLYIPHAMREAA